MYPIILYKKHTMIADINCKTDPVFHTLVDAVATIFPLADKERAVSS